MEESAPVFTNVEGFVYEKQAVLKVNLGGQTRRSTRSAYAVEHTKERIYADLFAHKPHQLYVGMTEYGPTVMCLKRETIKGADEGEDEESEEGQFRVILWSRKGRFHAVFPKAQAKGDEIFTKVASEFNLDKNSVKNLCRVKTEKKDKMVVELLHLEEMETPQKLLFGVVYGKDNQAQMDPMFGNVSGSDELYAFMNTLGAPFDLQNCDADTVKFAGFAGAEQGEIAQLYLTKSSGYELVFHVSTLMPYNSTDPQQLIRKRKIGNDIVVLVFTESDQPFEPSLQTSKVNHVLGVVRPKRISEDIVHYTISFCSKPDVPEFGPQLKDMEFNDPGAFRRYILAKLVNGSRSAYFNAPGFRREETTFQLLEDILDRYTSNQRWIPWSRTHKKEKSVIMTREEAEKGVCHSCKQPITSSQHGVSALEKIYHMEHFVCEHCGIPFEDSPFVVHPATNKVYCERDYTHLFNPLCGQCGEQLDFFIRALGKAWHMTHFCCAACGIPIGEETYFEKDAKAYCAKDYKALFLPKCGKCGEAIEGTVVTYKEKSYHPDCHTCAECKKRIDVNCLYTMGLAYHYDCFTCTVCHKRFSKEAPYFLFESKPYCDYHFHEKRGTLCFDCKQPITTGAVCRIEDKAFHLQHFKCVMCQAMIADGEQCFSRNGLPMCAECNKD